jgi:hypothetical protein
MSRLRRAAMRTLPVHETDTATLRVAGMGGDTSPAYRGILARTR